ncbi:hypothetical protein OC845_000739 [Tilletia horrida]|nr:hypothetical protein OC845_000739 [Tilletia horrida]
MAKSKTAPTSSVDPASDPRLAEENGPANNGTSHPHATVKSEDPSGSGNDGGGSTKKRRIWAACENCRIRKSKCDGKQPCSVCMHRARNMLVQHASHAFRTLQQQQASKSTDPSGAPLPTQPPEPAEQAVYDKALTMCVIDWDRKPRGPKSKAEKAASTSTGDAGAGAPHRGPASGGPVPPEVLMSSASGVAFDFIPPSTGPHPPLGPDGPHPHPHSGLNHHTSSGALPPPPLPPNASLPAGQLPPPHHSHPHHPHSHAHGHPYLQPPPHAQQQDQLGPPVPPHPPLNTYKKAVRSSTRAPGETAYQRQQQEIKQAQRDRERLLLHQQEQAQHHEYDIHRQHGLPRPGPGGVGSSAAGGPMMPPGPHGPGGYQPVMDHHQQPPFGPGMPNMPGSHDASTNFHMPPPPAPGSAHPPNFFSPPSLPAPASAAKSPQEHRGRSSTYGSMGTSATSYRPGGGPGSGSWEREEWERERDREWERRAESDRHGAWEPPQERERVRSGPGNTGGVKREWEHDVGPRDWDRGERDPRTHGTAHHHGPNSAGAHSGPQELDMRLSPRSNGPMSAPLGQGGRAYSIFGSHINSNTTTASSSGLSSGGTSVHSRPSIAASMSSPSVLAPSSNGGSASYPAILAPRAGEAGLEAGIASSESNISQASVSAAGFGNSANMHSSNTSSNAGTLLVQICTSRLLTALKDVYTEADRRFISIAIAHYDVFDSSNKMFPSRILFGERGERPGVGSSHASDLLSMQPRSPVSQAPYVAPAHLQVALLSVLAHRALLTPDGLSLRDLDPNVAVKAALPPMTTPAPSARATGAVRSGSGGSNSGRSSFGGSGSSSSSGPYQCSWLDSHDRHGLLDLARRSLKHAHDIFMNKIKRGDVEPSLIISGWLLDMSASEDGVSTQMMANMKATLFGILRKWNLHVLDSDPTDMSNVGPSHTVEEHLAQQAAMVESGVDLSTKSLAELARAYDARQLVKDPVERESLRRVVRIICASYLWTHALDNPPPAFEFNKIQIRQTAYDDFIHYNSAWIKPDEHAPSDPQSSMTLSRQHDLWALYARLVYMMNTPLMDLVAGRGPEKDLQEAVTNMEMTLSDIKRNIPQLRFEEEEQPLRIHLYLDTRMVELLLYRHLFPLYAYTKNEGISFNQSYITATTVFPMDSAAPTNYERFMGEQPYSYSADNPFVYQDVGQSSGNYKHVGLRFTRDPQRACFAPLFDIGRVIQAALLLISRDRTMPSAPGSEAGAVLPTAVRMLRWPRHLLLFAQHAFTLAAEVAVAGMAWDKLTGFGEDDPSWVSSPSMEGIPRSNSPQLVTSVWNIGCAIVDLMFAMAHAGSKHAREMAVKAEKFKDQRAAIMVSQGWLFRPRRGVKWSYTTKGTAPPPFEAGSADDQFDPDDEEVVLSPGMGKWFEPGVHA